MDAGAGTDVQWGFATYSKIIIWVVDLDLHFRSQDPNPDPGVSVSRKHKN